MIQRSQLGRVDCFFWKETVNQSVVSGEEYRLRQAPTLGTERSTLERRKKIGKVRLPCWGLRRSSCWKASMCKNQSGYKSWGLPGWIDLRLIYSGPFSLTSSFIRRSHQEWNQWKVVCSREVQNGQRRRLWKRKMHRPLPAQLLFIELKVDEREAGAMLSMLWSSQLPSLGSKTVEGSIHQPFYLHSADLHFPPSSPTSRVWFGSILFKKETPNNSTATERSDLPTRYGRTLDWLWDSVFWLGLAYWGQFHPRLLKFLTYS